MATFTPVACFTPDPPGPGRPTAGPQAVTGRLQSYSGGPIRGFHQVDLWPAQEAGRARALQLDAALRALILTTQVLKRIPRCRLVPLFLATCVLGACGGNDDARVRAQRAAADRAGVKAYQAAYAACLGRGTKLLARQLGLHAVVKQVAIGFARTSIKRNRPAANYGCSAGLSDLVSRETARKKKAALLALQRPRRFTGPALSVYRDAKDLCSGFTPESLRNSYGASADEAAKWEADGAGQSGVLYIAEYQGCRYGLTHGGGDRLTLDQVEAAKAAERKRPGYVSRAQLGPDWPLAIAGGTLECVNGGAVIFHGSNGITYAINGTARTPGKWAEIDRIWLDDPKAPGLKISIGPLIDRGLALC